MREYIHYTGAVVKVDDSGKKTIVKHGRRFRTFKELTDFERSNPKIVAKWDKLYNRKTTEIEGSELDRSDLVRERAKAKGEE